MMPHAAVFSMFQGLLCPKPWLKISEWRRTSCSPEGLLGIGSVESLAGVGAIVFSAIRCVLNTEGLRF